MGNSRLPSNDYYRVSTDCAGAVWLSSFGAGCVEVPPGERSIVEFSNVYCTNVGMVG